jgi:TonB family protein
MLDVTSSLGARAVAVVLSVSVHAAVALVAVHRGSADMSSIESAVQERSLEQAAQEIEMAEPPAQPGRARTDGAPPGHTHPYPVPRIHDALPRDPSLPHAPMALDERDTTHAAAPAVVETAAPAMPRFAIVVAEAIHAPGGTTASDGQAMTSGSSIAAEEPIAAALADTPARLLAGAPPAYTREAEAAGVEADVPLEIVIDSRGTVVSARVLSRAGYGLDEAALQGIRGYRFAPARREGRSVAIRMRWLMRFQLQ